MKQINSYDFLNLGRPSRKMPVPRSRAGKNGAHDPFALWVLCSLFLWQGVGAPLAPAVASGKAFGARADMVAIVADDSLEIGCGSPLKALTALYVALAPQSLIRKLMAPGKPLTRRGSHYGKHTASALSCRRGIQQTKSRKS